MNITQNKQGFNIHVSKKELDFINSAMLDALLHMGERGWAYQDENDAEMYERCQEIKTAYRYLYNYTGNILDNKIWGADELDEIRKGLTEDYYNLFVY